MSTVLADIANDAGIKIGGYGDQVGGSAQVTTAQLTANDDLISQAINTKYPVIRKQVIKEFAAMKCPFPETQKFADLGDDLKQDDVGISTIVSVGGVVTFTTKEEHELSVSDTRFFADIKGTLVTSLNGTTKTVATVPSTTTFTLTGVIGTTAWDHTEDSGIVSKVPEMGAWTYAFNLPSDFFALVRQTNEFATREQGTRRTYQSKPILNIDGDGFLLLSNSLTNCDADSAYIEYVIDQTTFAMFSPQFDECLAMLLAAELSPLVGRDTEFRQAMLVEYENRTIPKAKRDNQSDSDLTSKFVPDYSGGRSQGGVIPRRKFSDLGTFTDAEGNVRNV
ncbi:hypothetical protein LCGC14_1337950 [marine sediment metagenome]|uniref:Uncharacterized protein n=1 Tax=marine sediment metagenome TaxID=412755 RepID=A0A0F9KFA2_9ZZZZ